MLSYSRSFLWDNSNLSLNVFNDFEHKDNYGAYATISYTWGSTGLDHGAGEWRQLAAGGSFNRALGQEEGSYGYSLSTLEGRQPSNSASASYRAQAFQASAGVMETGKSVQATAQANGSVAFLNGVHFANRIDNSFAVVDTGVPNARVLFENNPVGTSIRMARCFSPPCVRTRRIRSRSIPQACRCRPTCRRRTRLWCPHRAAA